MKDLLKNSIRFTLIYFVISIIWQFTYHQEIDWRNTAGISMVTFFAYLLYDWAKTPYNWKKNKQNS